MAKSIIRMMDEFLWKPLAVLSIFLLNLVYVLFVFGCRVAVKAVQWISEDVFKEANTTGS